MLLVVNRKMADDILYFPPQQRSSQLEQGNNWKFYLFIMHQTIALSGHYNLYYIFYIFIQHFLLQDLCKGV